jgi:acyl carrier protein
MGREQYVTALQAYVEREMLEGDARDLDATTPLLELGLLDSFSIVGLLTFIETEFGVQLSLDSLTPENLKDIESIAGLVDASQAAKRESV